MDYRTIIKEALEGFIELNHEKRIPNSFIGTVLSIDNNDQGNPVFCTVQPLDENMAAIGHISLTSSDTQLPLNTPTIGSKVMVTLNDANSGYLSQIGDVSSVKLAPGPTDFGGLVKVEPTVDKLNNLENKVNAIINWLIDFTAKYNAHAHPYVNGSTPSNTSPTTSLETKTNEDTLTTTTRQDLENTTVTHGSGVTENTSYQQKLINAEIDVDDAKIRLVQLQNEYESQIAAFNGMGSPTTDSTRYTNSASGIQQRRLIDKAKKDLTNAEAKLKELKSNPE